jgi:hypothetical protein
MWTRVLVEDGDENLGDRFSAFYFLGPSDVRRVFQHDPSAPLTASVEAFFARKLAMESDFQKAFLPPFKDADDHAIPAGEPSDREWTRRRAEYLRFYTVRASAYYSLGSHDEWNIWCELNHQRGSSAAFGPAATIAGYYDGVQVAPGTAEQRISEGYASPVKSVAATLPVAEPNHHSAAIDVLGSSTPR